MFVEPDCYYLYIKIIIIITVNNVKDKYKKRGMND